MPEEQRDRKRLKDEEERKKREDTWKEVQEKMKKRSNPLDMAHRREVARAYESYLKTLPFNLRQLWLLTLSFKRTSSGIPYAVPRKKIPSLMRTNPKFYEKYREMVIGEEEEKKENENHISQ